MSSLRSSDGVAGATILACNSAYAAMNSAKTSSTGLRADCAGQTPPVWEAARMSKCYCAIACQLRLQSTWPPRHPTMTCHRTHRPLMPGPVEQDPRPTDRGQTTGGTRPEAGSRRKLRFRRRAGLPIHAGQAPNQRPCSRVLPFRDVHNMALGAENLGALPNPWAWCVAPHLLARQ